jgi:hypothetical protein
MAYMHKETFDIVHGNYVEGQTEEHYFEVDEMIALPIQVLNRKGYRTRFSCAGHPFREISELYMSGDVENPEKIIHGTISVEKVENPPYEDMDTRIIFERDDNRCYITFEPGVELPSLPRDFGIDEGEDSIPYSDIEDEPLPGNGITIHTFYVDIDGVFEYIRDITEAMECLYEWAVGLPDIAPTT